MNEIITVQVTGHENDELKLQETKLENAELKVQLRCQEEVIQKLQTLLAAEEKLLNEKLQTIWSNTAKFMKESNEFHQKFGISSTWWNAQIMSLQHSDMKNHEGFHKEQQKALESVLKEIEKTGLDVQMQHNEITKLKNQISAHDAQIVEQKIMEEMLQQELFGAEFSSLKAKLQRNKDTCQQMETVVTNRENTLKAQVRKRGPESLGNECLPTIMTQKVEQELELMENEIKKLLEYYQL